MLQHVRDLGFRIGEFKTPGFAPDEIAAACAFLRRLYGQDSTAIHPRGDEETVRIQLRQLTPRLAELADALTGRLETSHCGVLIPKFQLAGLDLDTRRLMLLALTLLMGTPSPTDQIEGRIIWDIKAREETFEAGHILTYSEHADEAELHTDTQYYPHPERYLALYFIRPAECGGGVSTLRSAACIKAQLASSEEGRWALDYLQTHDLPFRIPTSFTSTRKPGTVEVTLAPIFSQDLEIRYRLDTLRRGFAARPDYDTPDARKALEIFEREVQNTVLQVEKSCEADDFLIINNHEVLHGRKAFTDRNRHAVRIRIDTRASRTEHAG